MKRAVKGCLQKIVVKGCVWLVLGAIVVTVIILLAFLLTQHEQDWCSEGLDAGYCERFPATWACFCIDTTKSNNSIAIYDHAQRQCANLNGTVAVPDNHELLLWLSKKMYHTVNSEWVWIHEDGALPANNLKWRPDFPGDPQGTNAMVTVETLEEENYDDYYDPITYFNYDYYYENNRAIEPNQLKPVDELGEITTAKTKENEENSDPCKCSSREEIKLAGVEDSATLSSPGYPNNYCSDNNCSLEDGYDFVYVYDGSKPEDDSASKEALINTCTGITCADQKSTTNSMEVHFNSDHVTTDLGFKARVTAIEKDVCYCSSNAEITFVNLQESYTFQSPKYPEPYCGNHHCGWTLTAPLGYGIQLYCSHFELGQNDQLIMYEGKTDDGNHREKFDSHNNCKTIVSYSEDVHLVFESDDKDSGNIGFAITATAIKNYCETTIINASIGNISLSNQRPDGFIPVGETMTLSCPSGTKVSGTTDALSDQLVCEKTGWYSHRTNQTEHMPRCVTVCDTAELLPSPVNGPHVRICKLPTPTSVKITENGHSITVEIYNCTDGCKLIGNEYITCRNTFWQPSNPVCHSAELTIIIMGGWYLKTTGPGDWQYQFVHQDSVDSNMQMCNLATKECTLTKSLTSSDGQLFITNVRNRNRKNVLFKQVHTGQILPVYYGENDIDVGQFGVLDGDMYECNGVECYVYRKPAFKPKRKIAHYNSSANYRTMVGCGNALYALGGTNKELDGLYDDAVDKYLPNENRWENVMHMNSKRVYIAATQYNGHLYACGGLISYDHSHGNTLTQTCECYKPEFDRWTEIASMIEQRTGATLVSVMGKLYLIGGETTDDYGDNQTLSIDTYDISEDRWERDGFMLTQEISDAYAAVVPQMPDL